MIIEYLQKHASSCPEKTAFIFLENGEDLEKKVSYAALQAKVSNLAAFFLTNELGGSSALLMYQNTDDFIVAFLACQVANIIAIPVHFSMGSRQMSKIKAVMDDANAKVILSTRLLRAAFEKRLSEEIEQDDIVFIETDEIDQQSRLFDFNRVHRGEIAFIQYTSGSSGSPKGVMVSRQNLIENQWSLRDTFGGNSDSVIFSWLPFHHDMGLIGNILHAIYLGCTCVIMSPFHFIQKPLRWLAAISRYKVTHSGGPNFAYDLCLNKISDESLGFEQLDLSSWKVAYNGAEQVRMDTMERFSARFRALGFNESSFFPCYGLAEATLLVAGCKSFKNGIPSLVNSLNTKKIYTPSADLLKETRITSCGRVVSGVKIKIIAPNSGFECNELEEGEICISGKNVTQGYLNHDKSELFYEINNVNYLKTGDLGILYQDELYITGRIKEMLIIRGVNFFPYDLEYEISKQAGFINMHGVVAFSCEELQEDLVVIAELTREALNSLERVLVIQEINNAIVSLTGVDAQNILLVPPAAIPRTSSGKLQRNKCRELYVSDNLTVIASKKDFQQQQTLSATITKPTSEAVIDTPSLRRYLEGLILSKLGMPTYNSLAADVNLADIGIDSLKAVEIINKINSDLGISLNYASLLSDNTINGLIENISNMIWLTDNKISGEEIIL